MNIYGGFLFEGPRYDLNIFKVLHPWTVQDFLYKPLTPILDNGYGGGRLRSLPCNTFRISRSSECLRLIVSLYSLGDNNSDTNVTTYFIEDVSFHANF
jgi:hypothetical protein